MQISREAFGFANLRRIRNQLTDGTYSPAEICARYILLHLHARHPAQWLSGPRLKPKDRPPGPALAQLEELGISLSRKQREKLQPLTGIKEIIQYFFFRGVVLDSSEGLAGWLEERYPLRLRLDIPSPDEMLAIQCQGLRYVTLLLEDEQQFQNYGRHQDACDFLLHDFEHAHKFYVDRQTHLGQVRFFQALSRTLSSFALWDNDPAFGKDLDYLKSDMNSHPVHLLKYLKAVVLSAEMRRTGLRHPPMAGFWTALFSEWQLSGGNLSAALRINQPESETEGDLVAVAGFFIPTGENSCGLSPQEAR
jgi:hypothetical protein